MIIGLKCSTAHENYLSHLSFLLGKRDYAEMAGEISLPLKQIYPSYDEFEALYVQEELPRVYPKLTTIKYSTETNYDRLTGI